MRRHDSPPFIKPTEEVNRRSLHLAPLLLLAFTQSLRDRGSTWDQRGFVREPLREVIVIILHDVEHGFPGEPAMVFGQIPVQVCEFFVGHGRVGHNAGIYRNLLIPRQLSAAKMPPGLTGPAVSGRAVEVPCRNAIRDL
jgi:hypothetical protein